MFLHHGDKVAVQISSSELAKVTIKKPSSFSIVQIPEPIQYPSFVARLKVNTFSLVKEMLLARFIVSFYESPRYINNTPKLLTFLSRVESIQARKQI